MLPPTHLLSGWCFSNLLKLTPKERLFCMLAATFSDLDGIGIIISQKIYMAYHHIIGHNVFFGLVLSAVLTFFSRHKIKSFIFYLFLFHIHLIMDSWGSGPEWSIYYLWPFSNWTICNKYVWDFNSWQNSAVGICFITWTFLIVFFQKRTPLELLKPSLDKQFVDIAGRVVKILPLKNK